ncbi:cytochrome b [Halocynthiibacter sp.]|uniref:cytochrome b n=1 Tax=Halocynthiibacter sp. TaxID=1979210 RepID=UPI003C55358A
MSTSHAAPQRYAFPLRILHWLMALGFLFMWGCGFAMTNLVPEDSAWEETLFGLHISVGVTLIAFLATRLLIRMRTQHPDLPADMAPPERKLAHVAHIALYLVPALVMAAGWAEVDLGGHGVTWFGIPMPQIFPASLVPNIAEPEEIAELLHLWLAYGMLALVLGHILAVVKHKLIDGHNLLPRISLGKNQDNG